MSSWIKTVIAILKAIFGGSAAHPPAAGKAIMSSIPVSADPLTAGIQAVGEVAEATATVSKQITQRDAEKNTPAVQAGAVAVEQQKQMDKINKDMAQGNLSEIRKEDAE